MNGQVMEFGVMILVLIGSLVGVNMNDLSGDGMMLMGMDESTVGLWLPLDSATGLSAPLDFLANITESETLLTNFTLFHNVSGNFIANQTLYPEAPTGNQTDLLNGIGTFMDNNVFYFRCNNDTATDNSTTCEDMSGSGVSWDGGGLVGASLDGNEDVDTLHKMGKHCDSTNDLWMLGNAAAWEVDEFTYMIWVKPGAVSGTWGVVFSVGPSFVRIILNTDGSIQGDIAPRFGGPLTTGVDFIQDQWQHMVVRSVSGDTDFFLNGVKTDWSAGTGEVTYIGVDLTLCSRAPGGLYLNGSFDEFMMFNTNLTDDEIISIYNLTAAKYIVNYTVVNIPNGTYKWNVKAYDNNSDSAFAINNFTFTIGEVEEPPEDCWIDSGTEVFVPDDCDWYIPGEEFIG